MNVSRGSIHGIRCRFAVPARQHRTARLLASEIFGVQACASGMRSVIGLASAASSGSSSSPLETAFVALGAGLLFSLVSFLPMTDYRGVGK